MSCLLAAEAECTKLHGQGGLAHSCMDRARMWAGVGWQGRWSLEI